MGARTGPASDVVPYLTALSKGEDPGPENSIGKLVAASMGQDIASYGMDLMDAAGAISDPEIAPLQALFERALLYAPSGRIAGGSDEIMRNIIAERVLQLPPDCTRRQRQAVQPSADRENLTPQQGWR